jgi:hypothetical protein
VSPPSAAADRNAEIIDVDIRGFSDSADFVADARTSSLPVGVRNAKLADYRACVAFNQLQRLRRNPSVIYRLQSWNGELLNASQCESLDHRSYSDENIEALDRARVNDAGNDAVMAPLNRRIELQPHLKSASSCSIDALEKALGKYYALDEALPPATK